MDERERDALIAQVEAVRAVICKGVKLTPAQVELMDGAMRNIWIPLEVRNRIAGYLTDADHANLMPGQSTPEPQKPAQSEEQVAALVKKLKAGDLVWYAQEDPRGQVLVRGLVNRVMSKTVCIEVAGVKDPQVPKSAILAVEES